jgi:hypothetical protein
MGFVTHPDQIRSAPKRSLGPETPQFGSLAVSWMPGIDLDMLNIF